jgi:glycosyltransferase involved in cell wall biosynthesis
VTSRRPAALRVGHLIKGLGRGGAERLLVQLARAHGPGIELAVGYFLPWKDALVGELEAAGCQVTCFDARSPAGMVARFPAVAAWLRDDGVDLVHAHLPLAGVVARLAGRRAGVPVVYTEHNLLERYHPLTRRANLATWRLQRAVVAVSEGVAGSIARHAPPGVPVRVVRNGIEIPADDDDAGRAARAALGIAPDAPVVGTVAVFRRQKRLDLWLEIARRIAERQPAARFLLVGEGPLRAATEVLAARLGLGGRALFAGQREDVRPYLAALDVYLMSSEFEGLPLALLEAMAAGRAVVATAVGGVPEAIADGESGVVRAFGDVAGLAAAAAGLLADPARRAALGAAARRRVAERFGIRRMAGELEAIYREATTGEGVGAEAAGGGRG